MGALNVKGFPILTDRRRFHKQQRPAFAGGIVRRSDLHLNDFLPYLINRVGSALAVRFTQDRLAAHGLSIAMWRVLAALSNNGGQRQIDLAGFTSIDASTLSRLVTRLIRMGLVTRSRSRTNSREVVVTLSARGRAIVDRLIPAALDLEEILSAGVAKKDLEVVKRSLRKMYANMRRPRDVRRGSWRTANDHAKLSVER
jgi:MarR family transcriptional regulator, organic hydroperoxide resistance regulator